MTDERPPPPKLDLCEPILPFVWEITREEFMALPHNARSGFPRLKEERK
jgi:hypothetical protein